MKQNVSIENDERILDLKDSLHKDAGFSFDIPYNYYFKVFKFLEYCAMG